MPRGTYLPRDLPNPPIYSKVNPADAPIVTLALTSKTLPLTKVEDLADTTLAQKISQLPGVGLVTHQRRPEAGRAHPGPIPPRWRPMDSAWKTCARRSASQSQSGQGQFRRSASGYTIDANDQILTGADYGRS